MKFKPNTIYHGDCLEIMKTFPEKSINLIYLDPPFFSQKNYDMPFNDKESVTAFKDSIGSFDNKKKNEFRKIFKQDEEDNPNKIYNYLKQEGFVGFGFFQTVSRADIAEEDSTNNDFWKNRKGAGLLEYLSYMRDRLIECKRLLKDTGSIYLHCDWHASHYLKILMDEIFGYDNFRNEVIWGYRTGGISKKWFGKKHDNIYIYSKTEKYIFNPIEIKEYYDKKPGFPDRNGGKDEKGYYRCVFMPDIWNIPAVFNMSKERLGYPTQKPIKLLERIITASSNKGDIVLDPFCGCGTTADAALKLERNIIGIDISPIACKVMNERVNKNHGEKLTVQRTKYTMEHINKMDWFQFQGWACDKLKMKPSGKGPDGGVDGKGIIKEDNKQYSFIGEMKHWKSSIGRPIVQKLYGVLANNDTNYGAIVGHKFSLEAINQVKEYELKKKVYIFLIKTESILNNTFNINEVIGKKVLMPSYTDNWKGYDKNQKSLKFFKK